jgi:hypothetical protein
MAREELSLETLWLQNIGTMDKVRTSDRSSRVYKIWRLNAIKSSRVIRRVLVASLVSAVNQFHSHTVDLQKIIHCI